MWTILRMVKTAASEFINDGCMSSGAAIAYYSIFALPPVAMLVYLTLGYAGVSDEQINESITRRLGLPSAAAEITSIGESDNPSLKASSSTARDKR